MRAWAPEIEDSDGGMQLLELQAERAWERWLSKPEWELVGCIARAGEGVGLVPPGWNTTSGVMLWAYGLIANSTDFVFEGTELGDDLGIWLKTDWPTSMTDDWDHFYNSDTKEYGFRGWSNDVYIWGTMYDHNWQELKPPPGVAGYYPDPDWGGLIDHAEELLRERCTRCELPLELLEKLRKFIHYERVLAKANRANPAMEDAFRAANRDVEEMRRLQQIN